MSIGLGDRLGDMLRCAAQVETRGAGRWQLALDVAPAVIVDAHLDDAWLCLAAPVARAPHVAVLVPPERRAGCADRPSTGRADLLRRNGELGGGVKFAYAESPDATALELRAEIPLDDEPTVVSRRIAEACAAFGSVLAAGTPGAEHATASGGDTPLDLSTPLVASGWPVTERADGSFCVDLGVPDAFFQAEIALRGRATRVAVALPLVADAEQVCREALGLLLLNAAGVVRMARPALTAGAPEFQVVVAGGPSAIEIGHALSALAVACRLFGREVEVVQRSAVVAAQYCAVHARRTETRRGDACVAPTHVSDVGAAEEGVCRV